MFQLTSAHIFSDFQFVEIINIFVFHPKQRGGKKCQQLRTICFSSSRMEFPILLQSYLVALF